MPEESEAPAGQEKLPEIIIPDPAIGLVPVAIELPDIKTSDYSYDHSFNKTDKLVDLSFAGFQKLVRVLAWEFGNVTRAKNHEAVYRFREITYEDAEKFDCLVLLVCEAGSDYDTDCNYLVVLDYYSKQVYTIPTNVYFGSPFNTELKLEDFTMDGILDIIVTQGTKNHGPTGFGYDFFTMRDGEFHRVELLNMENEEGEYAQRHGYHYCEDGQNQCFSGYLLDDYKAVIEFPGLGFEQTMNLVPELYSVEELDDKYWPEEYEHYKDSVKNYQYMDGKVVDNDFRLSCNGMSYLAVSGGYVRCYFIMHFGSMKWTRLWETAIDYKYDPETDQFLPYAASIGGNEYHYYSLEYSD